MSELGKALLAFQSDMPALQRDAINPHFRNRHVSLENLMGHVLPKLNAAGLVVMQMPTVSREPGVGSVPALRTTILHAESGESIEDVMLLMPGKQDPQGQGSAITYARRYALMSALGLVADEDDDGNASSGAGSTTKRDRQPESASEAGSTPAPDTPFKAPTGKRGGGADVEKLRSELIELVTQLGATDSIASVKAHADLGDAAWLKRQITVAKKAIKDRQLESIPF